MALSGAVATLLVCIVAVVAMDLGIRAREVELRRAEIEATVHPYGRALDRVVQSRVTAVEALASFAAAEVPAGDIYADADGFSAGLMSQLPGLETLILAPDGIVDYSYPPEFLDACRAHDLNADEGTSIGGDIERAITTDATTMSGPMQAPWGGESLLVFKRVVVDGEYWGLAVGIIDVPTIIEAVDLDEPIPGLDIALVDASGAVFAGNADVVQDDPVMHDIPTVDGDWYIDARPAGGWDEMEFRGLPEIRLLGVLLSLAIATSVYISLSTHAGLRGKLAAELEEVERARATSEAREERFRLLFEQAPLPMLILEDDKLALVNQVFADLMGFDSVEQASGLQMTDLVSREFHDVVAQRMDARMAGGTAPNGYRIDVMTRAGQAIPVELSVHGYGFQGRQQTLVILTDLRERLAAEQVLRNAVSTYQALFDHSPTPMFEEDFSATKEYLDELDVPDDELVAFLTEHPEELEECVKRMVVVRVNPAAVEMVRAGDVNLVLGSMINRIGPESREMFAQEALAIRTGETSFHGQSYMRAIDGTLMWLDVTWEAATFSGRPYQTVYVSTHDLTEERRMRAELEAYRDDLERIVDVRTAELQATNEQLREATRAKDQFLAAMSHELRTPLNSIIGFSGTLLQGLAGDLNDEQSRQLEMVQNSGKHLLGLINQILDLSKIAAGEGELSLSTFDAAKLACAALGEIGPAANAKGLEVSCDTRFDDPLIHSDRDRVHQILLNLLSNAVKFTSSGSVALRGTDSADELEFIVSDTGRGIPRSERNRIFEPFQQIPGDGEAKPVGTGLGLAISRDLATMLGGTLDLVEKSEAGTEFKLCLPREAPDSPDAGGDSEPGSSVRGVE